MEILGTMVFYNVGCYGSETSLPLLSHVHRVELVFGHFLFLCEVLHTDINNVGRTLLLGLP